jgi:hypothetical protein
MVETKRRVRIPLEVPSHTASGVAGKTECLREKVCHPCERLSTGESLPSL